MKEMTSNALERELALARAAYTPSRELRERVLAKLEAAPTPAPPPPAAGISGAPHARPLMAALWGGGLVALGFVAGYVASELRAAPALPPLPPVPQLMAEEALAPDPASEPPQAEAADSRDEEPVLASSASPPRAKPHAHVSRARRAVTVEAEDTPSAVTAEAEVSEAPPAGGAREELALLQRAERAVRADNAALALALISELEERYPRSTLLEERRAIELMAYCVAGASDGRARAQHFIHAHPRSVYAARIAELCPAGSPAAAPEQQ